MNEKDDLADIPVVSGKEVEIYFGKSLIEELKKTLGNDAEITDMIFRANGKKGKIKRLSLKEFRYD